MLAGVSDEAEIGELFAHRNRHQCHLIFFTGFQIWRRVCRLEIAPSLERPAWGWPDRDQRRRQQEKAARLAVLLGALLKADQALANEDRATNDPVERPAIEQFVLLFRKLISGMVDTDLTVAMLALAVPRLPLAEVLDRGGADAQFDKMQSHQDRFALAALQRQLGFPQQGVELEFIVQELGFAVQ